VSESPSNRYRFQNDRLVPVEESSPVPGPWVVSSVRFSPLTRDELIKTVDQNTVALETFGRELARLQRENRELEAALAQGQANCDAVYEDLRAERDEALAERDAARAEAARLSALLACGARACPIVLVIHKS